MSNRSYEVVEKIAVLSTTTRTKREVRRVRWDGKPDAVLDIRKWRQEIRRHGNAEPWYQPECRRRGGTARDTLPEISKQKGRSKSERPCFFYSRQSQAHFVNMDGRETHIPCRHF